MTRLRIPIGPRDHVLGPASAEVTLVEYGDYQCPFCRTAFPILEEARRRYGRILRFVYRHFPLQQAHPFAMIAAEAAEAAGAQAKFWQMHATLFRNQHALDVGSLLHYGAQLELDLARIRRDLETHAHGAKIREDFTGGARSGVNGTPCLFIAGERFDGPLEVDELILAIERARAQPETAHR